MELKRLIQHYHHTIDLLGLADNCAPRYDVCRYPDIADSCAPDPDSCAPDPDNCAPEPDNCAPVCAIVYHIT